MVDSEIKPGDVAIDLAQGSLVQVVRKVYDTVERHKQQESYDIDTHGCNPLFNPDSQEPVFLCVYVGVNIKSLPDASYDFPASRLVRVPVEEANESLVRVQREIEVSVLERVLAAVHLVLDDQDFPEFWEYMHQFGFDNESRDSVVSEADELGEMRAKEYSNGGEE